MFFLTFSSIWSLSYFFYITHTTTIIVCMLYVLPVLSGTGKYAHTTRRNVSDIVNGLDVFPLLLVSYLLITVVNMYWVSPSFSAWFGHLVVSDFQIKMCFFVTLYLCLTLIVLLTTSYMSSREFYDYLITIPCFTYWLIFIFYVNSLFTSIFVIEVLSALIFLMLVTSTFSTTYFYRNLNLNFGQFAGQTTPHTHLQSLIFFFWMSLVASLNLFLFILLLYTKLATLDWYLMEYVLLYIFSVGSKSDTFFIALAWFMFMGSLFVKCGVAPFYIWKPTFFKGLPYTTLFVYISFFYFFIFLFFIYLLNTYLSDLLLQYSVINFLIILTGVIVLLAVICESYYLKIFLAISSILNSLLVVLALVSTHTVDTYFWL
jgi:hypothetical protein